MDVVSNSDAIRRGKVRASRMEHLDDYNSYSRGIHSRASYELNVNRPEYVNFQGEEIRNPLGYRRPTNQWGVSSEGSPSYCGSGRGRFGYDHQGQSGYSMNSYYERLRYMTHDMDSFENLENNRVELLRKLDELEDQLSSSTPLTQDDMASQYASQAPGFSPFTNRHNHYFSDLYSQRGHPHEYVSYADTYRQEMSRRPSHQPQAQYSYWPYHEQVQACFCVHCCNKNSYLPPKVDPSGSYIRRSQHERSENDGFNYNRRAVETHREQVWHPIAGGAPIVACFNCFEVLKLPREHLPLAKTQQKVKCGACSSVILLHLGKRGSTVPDCGHVDQESTEIEDASSLKTNENDRHQHGGSKATDMNAFCNDFDDHDKKLTSDESEKQLDNLSEDELNTETLASEEHTSLSADDHCSSNIVINELDKGKTSKIFDLDQNTPSENNVEDSVVATEITLNSGVSRDSVDQSEEHHPMVNKGVDKNRVTESRQYSGITGSQVFVNGHLIPDHLVQKAEKLAGPIQPGEYWYDVHAGFWGVMGHPCLGIIMPNIEEFNYPMPENCGAGNTGIFVNGRELHPKDLVVLAGRGLPDIKHGSYIVQISGKVVDEHTGEELHSLGKLAPTVLRAKRGFGMKVPSFIARSQI